MLLSPQHFQQESLRNQTMVAVHARLASPFHWGVSHLLIDRVALVSGIVRVQELEGVMPDGLIISHDQTSPISLELDISEMGDPFAQAPLTIHVAVPAARTGTGGGSDRWLSVEGNPVADEYGGEEVAIPRLLPRLSLVVTSGSGEHPAARMISMPIARVSFANDTFAMVDFAPPALTVAANSTLGRAAADIARRVREKAKSMAERMAAGESGESAQEMSSLVAALPPLEAQLAVEVCHPFAVYMSLCALTGSVAALTVGGLPPKLSRYDHNDPLPAYAEIRNYILKMIDRVHDIAVAIHFTFADGMFGLEMKEEWVGRRLVIGVRGPQAMASAEIVGWMDNALVGSRSQLERLAAMRVKGAERAVIESAPELGVASQRGLVLFAIEHDPEIIMAGEPLEIWNPDNLGSRFCPTDILLFVLG
jgi:type VI secretion system protein ImpJ